MPKALDKLKCFVLGLRTRNLHITPLLLGPIHIEKFAVH